MTLSNEDFARRFATGHKSGKANRMEIREVDGVRVAVGYGWAVYAAEIGGLYVLFGDGYASDSSDVGWAGYSSTTTKHLQTLKGALREYVGGFTVADVELTTRSKGTGRPEISEIDDVLEFAHEHSVEPREATGYYYRQNA